MRNINVIFLLVQFWIGLSMCHGQDSVFVYNLDKAKIYYSIDYSTLYVELDRTAGEEEKEEAIAEMSSYSEVENIADNIYRLHIVSPADVNNNPSNYSLEQDGNTIYHLNNHLEIQANVTGLQSASSSEVRIYGVSGGIRVTAEKMTGQEVMVLNMLGQTMFSKPLQMGRTFIPLLPGIYIVRIGKTTEKVIVR